MKAATPAGFRCPKCLSRQTRTTDVRQSGGFDRRRRKECKCGHRFTTYEVTEESHRIIVGIRKKDLTRDFARILKALMEVGK